MTTRRQFLLGLAGSGALGAAALARWIRDGELANGGLAPGVLAKESRTARALGAPVSITALHEDAATARAAVDASFAELDRVEDVMSLYRPASDVCRLNRDGSLERPHTWLLQVLERAQELSARSGGLFDVTVQPLWELHARAAREGRRPADDEVARAVALVDRRLLRVSPSRIELGRAGMKVTLNGIAQGFAADRVLAVLRAHGIEHALVDAGELGSIGRRDDGGPWTAGVQHPRRADAWVALARLDGRCVATSGDYETAFTEDRSAHHIVDPRTGRSPHELASVTVVAPTGLDADGLSTAVFVLGAEDGLSLIEATPGADALIVTKEGEVLATRSFPRVA